MPVPARINRGRGSPPSLALLAVATACAAAPAPADARSSRAVLAFLPAGGDDNPDPVLDRLDARPQLALGLVSATQGLYSPEQALLDISAGSRTSAAVYDPRTPPQLELVVGGDGSGFIFGWSKVARAREHGARARSSPGLLASRIPGGAGLRRRARAARTSRPSPPPTAPGDVDAVSLGPRRRPRRRACGGCCATTASSSPGCRRPPTATPRSTRSLRDRSPATLLIVMQTPPRARAPQLLPTRRGRCRAAAAAR